MKVSKSGKIFLENIMAEYEKITQKNIHSSP